MTLNHISDLLLSGNWVPFEQGSNNIVYMANTTFPADLLPNHAHKFVTGNLPLDVHDTFATIAEHGKL